jgi:hypothetical protein
MQPLSMFTTPAASDYAPYRVTGTASINGQAFLTTRGGDVKLGAGSPVTLDPATPYAKEWYEKIGMATARFAEMPQDSLFRNARQTSTVDAQGRFKFTNLPAGTYLLRSIVTWETGGAYTPTQGGVVSELVTLTDGESKDVIMNKTDDAYLRAVNMTRR